MTAPIRSQSPAPMDALILTPFSTTGFEAEIKGCINQDHVRGMGIGPAKVAFVRSSIFVAVF